MENGSLNGTESHKIDVFISYSSKNIAIAEAIVSDLEGHGISCWYAPRNIKPGHDWVPAIKEGLTEAKVFVLIYTDESNASKQVMNEVALAFNKEKILVPFRLTEAAMNDELEYYLTRVHWLDAVGKPLEKAVEDLRKQVEDNLHGNSSVASQKNAPVVSAPVPAPEKKKKNSTLLKILIPVAAVLAILVGFLIRNIVIAPDKYMTEGLKAYNSEYNGTEDDKLARQNFEKASRKRPDAYYYLGKLDERAYDFDSAKEKYEIGMENGSKLATARLGYLYQNGDGVTADINKAKELYDKAYAGGSSEAEYYLGLLAKGGLLPGEDADANKALEYFNDSLKSPDMETVSSAYVMIGDLYKNGFAGVKRDYAKALGNYELAIKTNPAEKGRANLRIASAYKAQGEDVKADDYYRKSLEYYEKAGEAGNIEALNYAAIAYWRGNGCEINGQTAYDYFRKSAEMGNYVAMSNVGSLFRSGQNLLQKNMDSAYEWFKKAADAGYAKAMSHIGDMYLNGEYGKKGDQNDYDMARQWYEKAAENGDFGAYAKIGDMYVKGRGVEKDVDKGLAEYKKGIDLGDPGAMLKMGYYYNTILDDPDYAEALKYYTKAMNAGNISAMYNVGILYRNGSGVAKDYQEAARFFRMADEEGFTDAACRLGDMYIDGLLSDDQKTPDYEKAFKYYKKALDAGSKEPLNSLGYMYDHGFYVQKDPETARKYFKEAADNGSVNGAANYGCILFDEKDYKSAREYLEDKAGWNASALAAYNLGKMYFDDVFDGGTVANDHSKAKKFLLKALEMGYSNKENPFEIYAEIGKCCYDEKDYVNSSKYYDKAAEINSTSGEYAKNAGVIHSLLKNYDKAAQWYGIALDRGYNGEDKNDMLSVLKNYYDQKRISQETYEKYVKKWIGK